MGKDESAKVVEDVEEGEISDSTSVEEISEEDFVKQEKQEAKVPPMESKSNGRTNKPLNELFAMDVDSEEKLKRSSSSLSVNSSSREDRSNAKEVDKVVIVDSGDEMDVEKEEGELEEGEIDLDSEPADRKTLRLAKPKMVF
ncbi:RNA polymerase II C-terminal domain phosphatase-like 3 [Prunus yedoensis var. nudiflora]|uniref:RNA polymerase II C-terminal domain phosphatase-like 3 n=1 Tax=Prunus yedoensis var. nudiflora TaxID=2094558 RepID=A0A314XTT2_PRUYE|nr:RNA polymerase II C-terminal domain phosphatase-like 3 [Prunus yedoensis var. nudiflora]